MAGSNFLMMQVGIEPHSPDCWLSTKNTRSEEEAPGQPGDRPGLADAGDKE